MSEVKIGSEEASAMLSMTQVLSFPSLSPPVEELDHEKQKDQLI
jgi:hypothetical protein